MPRSRQLVAVMFTDIQGYTALMQRNEKEAIQTREKHRRIFNSITEKYGGRILQYYGDGTLSIFDSAFDAVNCGIEMQLGFLKDPVIPVRIGIHTGDVFFSEEDIVGDSVNVASRIESLAVPGSVFISAKVYDEIKNQESIKAIRLKAFKLKNVEKPIEVYAISNEGLIVPTAHGYDDRADAGLPFASGKQEQAPPIHRKEAAPFLATKLFIPSPRPKAVLRTRLIDRLNRGVHGKLTLVSAPAGFGKTTLVSEWIASCGRRVAWLSLEEGDSDLPRFLAYFVAALQTIGKDIGAGVLGMLNSPQLPPVESILTVLVNEIAAIPDAFLLVLDDYHVVDSKPVDEALDFLIDHLPPQMHLVIITREDPVLSLARLRARGKLTELRAADLRFTSSEAAGFFNQSMGLNLSEEDIVALETRTEGWIAGLQMAALSMQGRTDPDAFIRAFTGSHHYILDYLVEEVLHRQPGPIRSFLLQTSVLGRLCGALCDAVTGRTDSSEMLHSLERGNLFVIPLDDQRRWYRYHHLFAEVLQARLISEQPDQTAVLHQRASRWYERNGSPADAIHHALAAQDYLRAAELIELAWPAMDETFQTSVWLDWVKALPDELVDARPVLIAGYAWALLSKGELEAGNARLQDAERLLDRNSDINGRPDVSPDERVFVDEAQFRFLPASLATARSYHAQALGDIPGSVKYARQALDLLPDEEYLRRGPAAALLGLACWANGELEAAHQALEDAMINFKKAGNLLFALSGTYGLADIRIAQGRLREAIATYEQALRLAREKDGPPLLGTADLYLGLGDLYREWGDLETGAQQLTKSEELGEQAGLPDWRWRFCLAKGRLKEAEGDLDGALDQINEAERLYYRNPIPEIRPIAALKAVLWVRQGRLADALRWARNLGLSPDGDLSYLREFEHLTLARVLIARYEKEGAEQFIKKATGLLERLLKAAEEGERMGSVIQVLILQSLAGLAQGNTEQALVALERALTLAGPERYVRTFVDEGTPMFRLLSEIVNQGRMPDYAGHLLTFFEVEDQPGLVSSHRSPRRSGQPLIEPLSQRELEVLQLIAQGLSNQQISERLFLALSTVKGHNRNIFDKLEVRRRTEAVARARQLGLI